MNKKDFYKTCFIIIAFSFLECFSAEIKEDNSNQVFSFKVVSRCFVRNENNDERVLFFYSDGVIAIAEEKEDVLYFHEKKTQRVETFRSLNNEILFHLKPKGDGSSIDMKFAECCSLFGCSNNISG